MGAALGAKLFMHSVRLVLGDWRNAVRISGLLYLIYAVPTFLLRLLFPVPSEPETAADAMAALSAAPIALLTALFALVAFVWIAVAWHRYVLLDEMPVGRIPAFNGSRWLGYLGYSLAVGLIMLVAAVVVGLAAGIVFAIVAPLAFLAAIAAMAAALVVGYRLAPLMPAAAVGQPLGFRAAWEATEGATMDIVVLAIVSAVAAFLIDLPAAVLSLAGPAGYFLALMWMLGSDWLKMLVGVSILTTLYGVYVERRALPA